jgi:ComF family protein
VKLRRWLDHVLDFCYPGICASCDATSEGSAMLCAGCGEKLDSLANAAACERCAAPLVMWGSPCPHCLGRRISPFEKIIRLGTFDDPLKHLVHQMKYHRRWPLGEFLADRLLETERAKGLFTQTDVIVPVPLHLRRQISRGYNQADVIARRLASQCKIRLIHAVRRTRNTETQTHLHSYEKRLANVRGAFELRRAAKGLRGKHVVVVDDVMTVGATLKAVAQVLKKAEPASLSAIVLAVVDPKGRGFEII